jgi:hypothetical protein
MRMVSEPPSGRSVGAWRAIVGAGGAETKAARGFIVAAIKHCTLRVRPPRATFRGDSSARGFFDMRFHICAAAALAALVTGLAASATAQTPPPGLPYAGEVRAFGFNYCPNGWLPADGRPMSIAQNSMLFALLGTTYGGNGTSTFNLPDLRGRTPLGAGPGVALGQTSGAQPGSQPAFLGLTWCIAVTGAFPQQS